MQDQEKQWTTADEPQPQNPSAAQTHGARSKRIPPLADYYGNAALGGIAMLGGAWLVLAAWVGIEGSQSFFESIPALLALIAGVASGGLGFVGVMVNELLQEVRKMRLGVD